MASFSKKKLGFQHAPLGAPVHIEDLPGQELSTNLKPGTSRGHWSPISPGRFKKRLTLSQMFQLTIYYTPIF